MLSQLAYFDWSFKIKIEMKGEVNCQDHHKISGLPQSEVKRRTGQTNLLDVAYCKMIWFSLV
jgi:hypothetical protein